MAGIFNNAIFNNAIFNTRASGPPAPPADQGVSVPIPLTGATGGGGMPVSSARFEQPFMPKPKPYIFKRNTENADRADIEDIMRLLEKGGFLE